MVSARIAGGFAAAASIVFTALSVGVAAQQQPIFRAGVDIMNVDVVVLDKSGAPVPTLSAQDFAVTVDNKPRRVVSAEFISSLHPLRAAALRDAPSASSNRGAVMPRTLMFLVDTEQIPSGSGRAAMKGIGEYLDRLGAEDRVGIMTLTETRVAPTVDRASVRQAVDRLVGTSARLRDREMTFGEANGIKARDHKALLAYWSRVAEQGGALPNDRSCAPPRGFESTVSVSSDCVQQAEMVIERMRFETRRIMNRLTAIVDAMATIPDPKSIVLVSGGMYSDDKLRDDYTAFASSTERAHVSLSSIFIEPEASAAGGSSSDTRRLDSQVGFGGLVDLATVARGTAHRVVSTSAPALARVDRELSGYYIVAFERDATDVAGQRLELGVRTGKPDLTVITRKGLTPGRGVAGPGPEKAGANLKDGVGALLKTQVAVTQIPISIDAYALPVSAGGPEARIVLTVEVGRDPTEVAALGFILADAAGKVLRDGYEAPAKLLPVSPGRSSFVTAVDASAGRLIVRVGAIDAKGERGSLQHSFEVGPWAQAQIRLSDLMFGTAAGGDFLPAVGPSADGKLAMRLVVRDNSTKFDGVKVKLVVARSETGAAVDEVEIPLSQTPDPLRRFADASVRLSSYPPGEYVVSMIVTAQGAEVGRRQRAFVR